MLFSKKKSIGLFRLGGGSLFDGSILAAEGDIIVITMNFRLNYHGFLSSGDHRVKGKDEERIIKWNLIRINEDFLIKTDE